MHLLPIWAVGVTGIVTEMTVKCWLKGEKFKEIWVAYEDIDELELACDNDNAEDEVMAGQQAQQVSRALALLPAEQKTIMELAFLHDLPQATIADRLDLPLGTVKSRMRLAYEKLRVNLENVK